MKIMWWYYHFNMIMIWTYCVIIDNYIYKYIHIDVMRCWVCSPTSQPPYHRFHHGFHGWYEKYERGKDSLILMLNRGVHLRLWINLNYLAFEVWHFQMSCSVARVVVEPTSAQNSWSYGIWLQERWSKSIQITLDIGEKSELSVLMNIDESDVLYNTNRTSDWMGIIV